MGYFDGINDATEATIAEARAALERAAAAAAAEQGGPAGHADVGPLSDNIDAFTPADRPGEQ